MQHVLIYMSGITNSLCNRAFINFRFFDRHNWSWSDLVFRGDLSTHGRWRGRSHVNTVGSFSSSICTLLQYKGCVCSTAVFSTEYSKYFLLTLISSYVTQVCEDTWHCQYWETYHGRDYAVPLFLVDWLPRIYSSWEVPPTDQTMNYIFLPGLSV